MTSLPVKQAPNNDWFRLSAVVIFAIVGIAKILSASGDAKILAIADPILGLQFGHVMVVVGALELAIAVLCLINRFQGLSTILIAWFATNLLAYRLGLWWIGWRGACKCLGTLMDAIHIPPGVADNIMKVVLAYLFIGSYSILFRQWRANR
jgi:hypothetical protein